ncbi:MAG: PAS domain S-box protein [Scytonematopsis contorta HA4267-MV1]|nr:PAS domain S-box protein [Scytonematopsis contorta HA4267-MV1]
MIYFNMTILKFFLRNDFTELIAPVNNNLYNPIFDIFLLSVLLIFISCFLLWRSFSYLNLANNKLQQAEEVRRCGQEGLRKMVKTAPIGIAFTSCTGKVFEANDTLLEMLGWTEEEMPSSSLNWREISPEEYAEIDSQAIQQLQQTGSAGPIQKELIRKDGSRFPILVSTSRLESEQDEYIAFIVDLTKVKKIEAALAFSERRFRLLAEAIPHLVWTIKANGKPVFSNHRWQEYIGITLDEAIRQNWESLVSPDDLEKCRNRWLEAQQTGSTYEIEFQLRCAADGLYRWNLTRAIPVKNELGEIVEWFGTNTDIHDLKQTQIHQQFLSQLEHRVRQMSDPEEMVWEITSSLGKYLNVNYCSLNEINWSSNEVIVPSCWTDPFNLSMVGTYHLSDFLIPESQEATARGEVTIINDVTTDPRTSPHASNFVPLQIKSLVTIPCIYENVWVAALVITSRSPRIWREDEIMLLQETVTHIWYLIERKRAEVKLAAQEKRYRYIFDAVGVSIWEEDFSSVKVAIDKLKAKGVQDFRQYFAEHPEFVNWAMGAVKLLDINEATLKICKSQNKQQVLTSLHQIIPEESPSVFVDELLTIAAEETFFSSEAIVQNLQGEKIHILFTIQFPPPTESYECVLVTWVDISDRKQLEESLKQQTEDLTHANRLKDEFIAVLSHELRTPLNPILGWTKMLQKGNFDSAKITQGLETIERNVKLQISLIEDLLDVSRILRGQLRLEILHVDLTFIIEAAINTVHLAAQAKSIDIQFIDSSTPIAIMGDKNRLQQIFWNLLSNAIKFTPNGGRVEIFLEAINNCAQITITDTGIGIPSDFLPYIFEYFRQADGSKTRKFGGLGLGLAIVKHFIEIHGGTIQVNSLGEGQGTTFVVIFPLIPALSTETQVKEATDILPTLAKPIDPSELIEVIAQLKSSGF